jgi:hypothetical protein
MRQQAKPFTVEIKKSRKSASDHQPLFGFLEEAAVHAPEPPAARLFDGHNGQNGQNGHNGANRADIGADVARVFGTAEVRHPANRILPDLTAKPVVAEVEEEAPRQRRPRIAKSKAPRIPKPKPLPVTLSEPVAHQEVRAAPPPAIRVHRRPKDEDGFARAERWKRRLPRFAR